MEHARLVFYLLLFFLIYCPWPSEAQTRVKRAWSVMGTFAEVTVEADSKVRAVDAITGVRDAFERIDRTMSVHRPRSDITRLNRWAGFRSVSVDPWLADLIRKAKRASVITGGAFSLDVLAEGIRRGLKPPLVNVSGPGGRDEMILVTSHAPRVYLLSSSIGLDPGGIAKGYALDRAVEVLQSFGFDRYLVNLGRNLAVGLPPTGQPGWPVQVTGEERVRFVETVTISVSQQRISSDTPHVVVPGSSRIPDPARRSVVAGTRGWVTDMASTAILVNPDLIRTLKQSYPSIQWTKVIRSK